MRVPKFDGRSQLHLWSSRFQTFLTARSLIGALEPTSNPIRIAGGLGGMEERNRSVMSRRELKSARRHGNF